MIHQLVFLAYMFLPVFFLIRYELDAGGITSYQFAHGLPGLISGWEVAFWVWSVGYLTGEFEQVGKAPLPDKAASPPFPADGEGSPP